MEVMIEKYCDHMKCALRFILCHVNFIQWMKTVTPGSQVIHKESDPLQMESRNQNDSKAPGDADGWPGLDVLLGD